MGPTSISIFPCGRQSHGLRRWVGSPIRFGDARSHYYGIGGNRRRRCLFIGGVIPGGDAQSVAEIDHSVIAELQAWLAGRRIERDESRVNGCDVNSTVAIWRLPGGYSASGEIPKPGIAIDLSHRRTIASCPLSDQARRPARGEWPQTASDRRRAALPRRRCFDRVSAGRNRLCETTRRCSASKHWQ